MQEYTAYLKDANETIIRSLNNFLTNVNGLQRKSPVMEYNMNLSIQFITRIIEKLKVDGNTNITRNSGNDFRNITNYRRTALLNEKLQKYEKLKNDVQTKIARKKEIEHYFNVVERQLQYSMKKKITKSEAIIVAAMKEHEHIMLNLEMDTKSFLSKIETTVKTNEIEKNNRMEIRNNLQSKKAGIIKMYDSEMMDKYMNVKEFNSEIKMTDDSIYQLEESITCQLPFYNDVMTEIEIENDRIWHEKLYAIQRKIAARKIQIRFRQYLIFIKTRDNKKNKKGQHKKSQIKTKNN